ncbi:MAG: hypothetical protein HGB12_13895, partial [Bacteroidetes bacterium]|nr:hypothetical protein [Bacteroidota bacterium]
MRTITITLISFFIGLSAFAQTSGTLDLSFGTAGKVLTIVGDTNDLLKDIALQTDGKSVATGFAMNSNAGSSFAIVRYLQNGILDSSFGINGIVITPVENYINAVALSIDIQSNGKIIAAGGSGRGPTSDFILIRYNSNGTLDTAFGTNGIVITSINNRQSVILSVDIQTDGKIIAAGYSTDGGKYN